MKRNVETALAAAFLAGLLVLFIYFDDRQGEVGLRGRPAKNFSFALGGKPEQLSDLRGTVVVLNFWATWCPPCVDETPSLIRLQKHIAPLGGTVLGISLDDQQDAYSSFLRSYQIDFPTYRDPTKQSALAYGTTMYPETFIINREGRIDRKIIGPQDWTSPQILAYMNLVLSSK